MPKLLAYSFLRFHFLFLHFHFSFPCSYFLVVPSLCTCNCSMFCTGTRSGSGSPHNVMHSSISSHAECMIIGHLLIIISLQYGGGVTSALSPNDQGVTHALTPGLRNFRHKLASSHRLPTFF